MTQESQPAPSVFARDDAVVVDLLPRIRPRDAPQLSLRRLTVAAVQGSADRVFSQGRAAARLISRVRSQPAATPYERCAFTVSVSTSSRAVVLGGDFDLAAVERFTAAAAGLTVGRRGDVVVDLSEVGFIDAAGLGALVTLRIVLTRGGTRLVLRDATRPVARVFDVAGLSDLLTGV